MLFSKENLQTLRKHKKIVNLKRSKSVQEIYQQSLTPNDMKILLRLPERPSFNALSHAIEKQQLLFDKKLFDPFKYFGCPQFSTYQQSYQYHSKNLDPIFAPDEVLTERKVRRKYNNDYSTIRVEQSSPAPRSRNNGLSNQKTRRTVNRSPKSYVKENKQNFQRLNINSMQKVRVKLKLNKK